MVRQREWVASVGSAIGRELVHPHLRFSVSGLKRGGNVFDIDNLAKPVMDRIAPRAVSAWVEVAVDPQPGVHVDAKVPVRPQLVDATVYFPRPPTRSVRQTGVPSEVAGRTAVGEPNQSVGLWLAFDSPDVAVGNFDFGGPIKAVIDNLWPLLGGKPHEPSDHRIRDLRIVRGANPTESGVTAAVWLLT